MLDNRISNFLRVDYFQLGLFFFKITHGRDLGFEYIVMSALQSYPTTKMYKLLLCGVQMLTKKG